MKDETAEVTLPHKRVRCPSILQMEATECGAASLGMILGYFGKIVALEELRVSCGISRNGSSAKNVARAAKSYGLSPHAFRKEPRDLLEMQLPMVIFWNFNHFLVLEGFGNGKVYLNDPANGPRTVTWEEFDQSFTGIAITFDKEDGFVPGGKRPGVGAGLRRRLGNAKSPMIFVLIAGLALLGPGMAVPGLLKAFIDSYFTSQQTSWLFAIFIGMLACFALQLALSWVQQNALLRLQSKLSLRMSAETIRHLLKLPSQFFAQRAAGDLAFRAALNDQVAQLLSGQLSQALMGLLTSIFYAALMVFYDPLLTAIVVVVACANIIVVKFASRARKDLTSRSLREQAELTSAVSGGISLIESVKASGGEDDLFNRWAAKEGALMEANQRLDLSGLPLTVAPVLLTSIATAFVLGVGAVQVMDGNITLGTLVAFQTLMGSFLAPISQVVALGGQIQQISGNLGRLDDILHSKVDPELEQSQEAELELTANQLATRPQESSTDQLATRPQESSTDQLATRPQESSIEPMRSFTKYRKPLRGELELRNVVFGYSPLDPPLVDGLNLHLYPGQRVALVGPSGSGKSTVSKLVTGLYEPWSGEVLFDGVPRRSIDREVLADGIALVDQDIVLFEGTARENLSLWDSSLKEAQLVVAARDACILDDLAGRSSGLSSGVEEGGKNFSGGQRQRLEIARSLARNPVFMVLDEATSALDPLTEELIDLAIRKRGCTCLIVAHRLSAIRDSDEIVVLEKGKVKERGTHDQLMAIGGTYAELIEN